MRLEKESLTSWVPPPSSPPLVSRTVPRLVNRTAEASVIDHYASHGIEVMNIDLGKVTTTVDVFQELRKVLLFPEWCGSGWDSAYDAFEEIKTETMFPVVVLADGLQALLESQTQLALHTLIHLTQFQYDLARANAQLEVIYLGDDW